MKFIEIINSSDFLENRKRLEVLTNPQLLDLAAEKGARNKNVLSYFFKNSSFENISTILGVIDIYKDYYKSCIEESYVNTKNAAELRSNYEYFILIKICFDDLQ